MNGRTLIIGAWGCGLLIAVCGAGRSLSQAAPTSGPSTVPVPSKAFAPFAYFENNCARCHGAYGSAYGPDFGKKLDDEQLKKVIDDMAVGPGDAPVDARELTVLWAYHKAMIAKSPFVIVTKVSETNAKVVMTGEVTPGAVVTVDGVKATVEGHDWRVTLPLAKQYKLNVKLNDSTFNMIVER